jgi:ribokinase
MTGRVLVLGAVNVDMVARTEHRPAGGETVIATGYQRSSGGKGANQAAAAARAGADVALVAAVGDDEAGVEQLAELRHRGVRTDSVATIAGAPTGVAMITVTPDGENAIVIVPGANEHLDVGHVDTSMAQADEPAVLVLQTEINARLVDRAASQTSASRVVLNNGPWVGLAPSTLRRADPLVVNEVEARDACGQAGANLPAKDLARGVREVTQARTVLVTLGSAGVSISSSVGDDFVAALPASTVVDTTGAGDTFVGTLAAYLARGEELTIAVGAAVSAASEAVTWRGARPPLEGSEAIGGD